MSNSDNQQELIERYLTAYNSFDVDGMLAVLSPDVRFENYSGGQLTVSVNGIEEFKQLAEQSSALFSEREQRVTRLTVSNETAMADIAYRGRLAVDLPDGPASGTVLDLKGQSEFYFKGGRISKIIDRS